VSLTHLIPFSSVARRVEAVHAITYYYRHSPRNTSANVQGIGPSQTTTTHDNTSSSAAASILTRPSPNPEQADQQAFYRLRQTRQPHFTPLLQLHDPARSSTMPFMPIGPCCLEGNTLPGEPAGVVEAATDGNPVARYHAKPKDGNVVDSKTALVLFYDAFGLGIVSARAE
jgi:hypothetical protein